MKKYVTLTIISVFLLATFSIYYIHSALAKNNKTQFYIEYVDGDKELVKDISVMATSHVGNMYESFTVTEKETSYASDQSFFERIDSGGQSGNKQFRELENKYPSFMRGKYSERVLFEDDSQVIYAEVNYSNSFNGKIKDFRFSIDTLTKKDEQTNSYTIDVPKQQDIIQMEVYDVQYVYDEVRIITANQRSNPYVTEIHQYTINLNKERITDDKVIFSQTETTTDYYSTIAISERNPIQPSSIVMFNTEEIPVNDDGQNTQSKLKTYIYHYKDAKLSELTLPAKLQDQTDANISYMYDQEYLYVNHSIYEGQQLKGTMYKIDLKTGKIVDTLNLTTNNNLQIEWISLYEDSIQVVGHDSKGHPAFAFYTLEEGKLLFEGRMTAKESDNVNFTNLNIYIDMVSGI